MQGRASQYACCRGYIIRTNCTVQTSLRSAVSQPAIPESSHHESSAESSAVLQVEVLSRTERVIAVAKADPCAGAPELVVDTS